MMKQAKRIKLIAGFLVIATVLSFGLTLLLGNDGEASSPINLFGDKIQTNRDQYLNSSVVMALPETVKDTDEISVILQVKENALLDAYLQAGSSLSFAEYAATAEAEAHRADAEARREALLDDLASSSLSYTEGKRFSNVISGFEVIIQAGDFEALCKTVGDRATPIVGEVYNKAETETVEGDIQNNVNVYDTGIFDSSELGAMGYDGTGMVVAVLDTGLDYFHTAFSTENFSADRAKLGLTFSQVTSLIEKTRAYGMEEGLTASDVYISDKVPYGFDYADGDSDVFPLQSNHGTHVAGVIAGKDSVITGVAPNAQLVIMKTFSDVETSARSSWILAALDDCVYLGVDVINMSLGTACGFSRENDKEAMSGVYDKIREVGISLVVAASNSFNSTYGSEKNGNLGLTSNPDSATVGSPGTYSAAMSVASINGAETPYLLYHNQIIYFTESNNRVSEEKHFVDEFFQAGQTELEIEYITIPGAGRSADYTGIDVKNKIVLVRRGATTFEEKANVAQAKGAAGVIIYNNVSGEIKMNVGDTTIPVCSIRQDDGEMLAAAKTGTIKLSRSQTSGPFMSDFSSWGPTPDLGIKPEITAHGGSILSAVPGQDYDRISGTSMACPNMAGTAALLRQYVIQTYPHLATNPVEVTAFVNRLLMSTADIVINTNGLPYAVRKQGAGLANMSNSVKTSAYILTYDRKSGAVMDRSKIELGDDPQKTGVYTMKLAIQNFGGAALTYDMSAYVMTEGVSDTKTNDGKTTVTEQGYMLDGARVEISSISGGVASGMRVTVEAGATAEMTVTVTLSDADKSYLDASFANGMYVEGFLVFENTDASGVDLSVPYLAFYGDWTVAPLFDLDYFATNRDELDDAIDLEDKTLPDAYATRPIGGIEDDYVSYLGSYYFLQNPANKLIAADRNYIALSNQTGSIRSLRFVWAGLLRNAERIVITITDDSTGEVIFERVEDDVRKSYGDGGSIHPANVEIEFDAFEHNLKNNAKYTVTLKGYLDYDNDGASTNLSNTFSFPLTVDFEAPVITDCEFYTEYDKSEKKTRLFAKMAVYDNHYAMALQTGFVGMGADGYVLNSFDQYLTPVYSSFNSTTYVTYELTDFVDRIREGSVHKNTFTVCCYDYALNQATYEIALPSDFEDFYFAEAENGLTLSPNEVYTLNPLVYPGEQWPQLLEYASSNLDVARVVNNKIIAVSKGTTRIIARDPISKKIATFPLTVLGEGDEGYKKYDKPVTDSFYLVGYQTLKAYYQMDSADRKIGSTGDEMKFVGDRYALTMYPSESVMLRYQLDMYFPDDTEVVFESSNDKIVKVDQNGIITAVEEGLASITVRVMMDGKSTYYSKTVNITVEDPYITTGPSLTHYFGNGGRVHIPTSLAITEIGQYAFSNFDYIPKEEGEEISEENPGYTKIWFLGDDTIEEVIIPEGVEKIGPYAFANLTALTKVTLPSTLVQIDQGAFYGCSELKTVVGIENVKFINQSAFQGCALSGTISLDSAVALADYAFAGNEKLQGVVLSESTTSVGAYAFAGDKNLKTVTIQIDKIKLGRGAFQGCAALEGMVLNTAVIPAYTFDGCTSLSSITLGRDVAVVGEYAFRGTDLNGFTVQEGNTTFYPQQNKPYLLSADGKELLLVAPAVEGVFRIEGTTVQTVANGAFSGCTKITSVELPGVTTLGNYAFAGCRRLSSVTLGELSSIGAYAFYQTRLTEMPSLGGVTSIGAYAFAETQIASVTIPDGMIVGESAFRECKALATVVIGNNVKLGANAFRLDIFSNYEESYYKENGSSVYYYTLTSPLTSLTIGDGVSIGNGAFYGASKLVSVTLGRDAEIGDRAFYNAASLKEIDLSKATSIGREAFSRVVLNEFTNSGYTTPKIDANGDYIFRYYAALLESADLSKVTTLGESAFAYCEKLASVALSDDLKIIPARAFQYCKALTTVDLSAVESVGSNAFYQTALTVADLSSATEVESYAFAENIALREVKLNPNGSTLGEGAFAYCSVLRTVGDMQAVRELGDYCFAYTAVIEADLTGAVSIGTHAFLKESLTDLALTLGEKLEYVGDNPFALCRIRPFHTTVTESFNGKDYTKEINTFDLGDHIKVIDGHLYRIVPNGLEMICYTGDTDTVTVAEGTVRISDMAMAGTSVVKVILPQSLKAIGHKAFYGCEKLVMVSFASYKAPILEELFDLSYFGSGDHYPATGTYSLYLPDGKTMVEKTGLGIVPYFMWNISDLPSNVYYGANFVDYVGHIDNTLVMVCPSNGLYYDSFILDQYFATTVAGTAAADETTLAAIAAINRLPEVVNLSDKALVVAAREAYDQISSLVQRSLVTNYAKLTKAEKRITDLEFMNADNQPEPEQPPAVEEEKGISIHTVLYIILGVLLGAATATAVIFGILYFKKGRKQEEITEETAEEITEETTEEVTEEATEEVTEETTEEATEETTEETTTADESEENK